LRAGGRRVVVDRRVELVLRAGGLRVLVVDLEPLVRPEVDAEVRGRGEVFVATLGA
jgi:hypothetical protein